MREIQLSKGLVTQVSDEDYESLSVVSWSAYRIAGQGRTGKVYLYGYKAGRKVKNDEGAWKRLWIHNVIMSTPDGMEVDHKDGNPLNNQRDNLRIVSHGFNCFNRGKRSGSNTAKYIGVCKKTSKNRFCAEITHMGKRLFLGYFDTAEEAALAYNKKATELFGEFARLNVIE